MIKFHNMFNSLKEIALKQSLSVNIMTLILLSVSAWSYSRKTGKASDKVGIICTAGLFLRCYSSYTSTTGGQQ